MEAGVVRADGAPERARSRTWPPCVGTAAAALPEHSSCTRPTCRVRSATSSPSLSRMPRTGLGSCTRSSALSRSDATRGFSSASRSRPDALHQYGRSAATAVDEVDAGRAELRATEGAGNEDPGAVVHGPSEGERLVTTAAGHRPRHAAPDRNEERLLYFA